MQLGARAVADAPRLVSHAFRVKSTLKYHLLFQTQMFSIVKRNRHIIPAHLSGDMNPDITEKKVMDPVYAFTYSPVPVAQDAMETIDTPPLTPASDIVCEGSTNEPSSEEPIVEAASKMTAAAVNAMMMEAEISSDESEGISEDEDENNFRSRLDDLMERLNYKIYTIWFIFWLTAIIGMLVAFHVNSQAYVIDNHMVVKCGNITLRMVPREKWDDTQTLVAKKSTFVAERVVVFHTDTDSCNNRVDCTKVLNDMKYDEGIMIYNFLLATDGCIYEALGWQEPSPLYPEECTLVVGFIGNYDTLEPSYMQLSQLQTLLELSEELKYLEASYTLVGRKLEATPSKLFDYLAVFDRWDPENSDFYDEDTDEEVEFEPFTNFDE